MTPRAVVDASVAAQWVVPSPNRQAARQILIDFREMRLDLFAPSLQRFEIGSALWKYFRAGIFTMREAEAAHRAYLEQAPELVDSEYIARSALSLSAIHDRSVYDCSYLALSLQLGCELLTADKKLFRALGPAFPQIVLVGADTA